MVCLLKMPVKPRSATENIASDELRRARNFPEKTSGGLREVQKQAGEKDLRDFFCYDYAAFGETYTPNTSVTVNQRYTYTGRELNAVSGSMAYRYRTYFPWIGRMNNRNPWGYVHKETNLYDYVSNNPSIMVEPYSLDTIWDVALTVYDAASTVKNTGEVLYDYYISGDDDALVQDAEELEYAATDTAVDAGSTLVPGLPAGSSKVVRALRKAANAAEEAKKLKKLKKATPPKKPKQPKKPLHPTDGDCTPTEAAALRAAKAAACKVSDQKMSCKGLKAPDDCPEMKIRLALNIACLAAREAYDKKCWRGGDDGHRKQRAQNQTQIRDCNEALKCCP